MSLWNPVFFAILRFPLKKARLVFIFLKMVGSRHLFLFYFNRKNKIRNKNPKCNS